jgi:hypothetical protein
MRFPGVQPGYSQPLQYPHLLGRRGLVSGCQQTKSTRRSWAKNLDHRSGWRGNPRSFDAVTGGGHSLALCAGNSVIPAAIGGGCPANGSDNSGHSHALRQIEKMAIQRRRDAFCCDSDHSIQRNKASRHSIRVTALWLLLQLGRTPCLPQ